MFGIDDALIGAGVGALLGGLGGGSKPSGNVTSTSTQTQDLPPWLKSLTTGNLDLGADVRNNLLGISPSQAVTGYIPEGQFDATAYLKANPDVAQNTYWGPQAYQHYLQHGMSEGRQGFELGSPTTGGSGNLLTKSALPEYLKTISGAYLDPASNPYLDATYKHSADLVGSGVDSRFSAAGRYGSGAHQAVLQEGLDNLANSIFGGNYQAERARQAAAVGGAPAFSSGITSSAFAPLAAYNSLIPNLRSTNGTSSQPYFTNPLGNVLSGALAGSVLGNSFGGTTSVPAVDMGTAGAGDLMTALGFLA